MAVPPYRVPGRAPGHVYAHPLRARARSLAHAGFPCEAFSRSVFENR